MADSCDTSAYGRVAGMDNFAHARTVAEDDSAHARTIVEGEYACGRTVTESDRALLGVPSADPAKLPEPGEIVQGVMGEPHFADAAYRVEKRKGKFRTICPPDPKLEGPIADSHTHLAMLDAPYAIARAAAHNMSFLCCMADIDEDAQLVYQHVDEWRRGAARQEVFDVDNQAIPDIRLTVGMHPHNAKDWNEGMRAQLMELLADPRTAAVGEIGLDYHYDLSPRDAQREVFAAQLEIAKETQLPVQLHIREAHDDALAILDASGVAGKDIVLHCCTLGPQEIAPWIERGCYIAYGGALTFTKSDAMRAACTLVPEDRLLVETDSPYMAPVPLRGTECYPDFTVFTYARLAFERGLDPGEARRAFIAQILENARTILDRKPSSWQRTHNTGA